MVTSCAAFNCTAKQVRGCGLSFHRFPSNPDLRKKWIIATKRANFNPSKYVALCSKHFKKEDYLEWFGPPKLKPTAVPSIFDFPSHLQKNKKPRISRTSTAIHNTTSKDNFGNNESGPSTSRDNTSNIDNTEIENQTSIEQIMDVGQPDNEEENRTVEKRSKPMQRKRTRKIYLGDFTERDMKSTRKAKLMFNIAKKMIERKNKELKYLRNREKRLRNRVQTLTSLVDHLKNEKKISDNAFSVLQESLPEAQKQMLLKQLKQTQSKKYPPELRSFALTLNFYSPSAYSYVRKTFGNCLPHPDTLRKWYSSVDGTPGFTQESLRALKIKAEEAKQNGKNLLCSLMMDETSIRRHIEWDGNRYFGYINYGTNIHSDALPDAKDVLVFLIVGVNTRWKIPVGYFLINGLTSEDRANLVKRCLLLLHDTAIKVISLTFDGAACNISMAKILGAIFEPSCFKTWFSHPVTNNPVYFILDVCHMIKLIRNCLGDWKCLLNEDGEKILWRYFEELVNLQEKSGLHAGTKIRRRHLNYNKEKMKVKLAAQTLSESVADALDFCNKDLHMTEFVNSEATAEFCRIFNNLFDILNSRNSLSKNIYKRPFSIKNELFFKKQLEISKKYIKGLKNMERESILISKRKTGFLGLLISIESIEKIFDEYVKTSKELEYVLTYKMSQDHLEMFFSAIRSRGGFNDNPSAKQFENAYKRLLIHAEITSSISANCLAQDGTSVLNVSSSCSNTQRNEIDILFNESEDTN